ACDFVGVIFVLLVHEFEKLVIHTDRFGGPKNQQAARIKSVVEVGDAALVQFRAQINQNVALTDYVETREGRIRRDVLPRERADIAHVAMNLITAVAFNKKTFQSR